MSEIVCRFKPLHKMFEMPKMATAGAACFDLKYCGEATVCLYPAHIIHGLHFGGATNREAFSLGFAIEVPPGYEFQIRPRSGLAIKHGVTILNSPGTIDSDYRGEVKAILVNLGFDTFTVEPGMKICQGLISKLSDVRMDLAEDLSDTARGSGGFGSTGV